MRAEAVIAGGGEAEFDTLQDALAVAAGIVREHARKIGGIDHLAMHSMEWEMLADKLEEASMRSWLQDDVTFRGPDDQVWGARWKT